MNYYKYYGSDGNGGSVRGTTKNKYKSKEEAIRSEIIYLVHRIISCEVVIN
jgi:hypothetical protein